MIDTPSTQVHNERIRKIIIAAKEDLNNKNTTSHKQLTNLLDLSDATSTGGIKNQELLTTYANIVEKCQHLFSPREKYLAFCYCPDEKLQEQILGKYQKEIETYFENTIFVDIPFLDDITEVFDFEYDIKKQYPTKNYQIKQPQFPLKSLKLTLKYFKDKIKIIDAREDPPYTFHQIPTDIYKLKLLELLDIKESLNLKAANSKDYDFFMVQLIGKMISHPNKEIMTNINKKYPTLAKELYVLLSTKGYQRHYNKLFPLLENEIKETKPKLTKKHSIDSFEYATTLYQLQKLPPRKRTENKLYLTGFQVFLQTFLKNYQDPIDKETLSLIEIAFQRSIADFIKKDFHNIFLLQNKKSLLHYYKTKEITKEINLTLEEIRKYNAKQYLAIKNHLQKNQEEIEVIKNTKEVENLIFYLNNFDYEETKSLYTVCGSVKSEVLERLKKEKMDYIHSFITFLHQNQKEIKKETMTISEWEECYKLLYSQKEEKITISKIKKIYSDINYLLVPYNRHIAYNLEQLNFVSKGEPLENKVEGIKLYDEYRHRQTSSIPEVSGKEGKVEYSFVDLQDPNIISNGIGKYLYPNNVRASSCLTPAGKAASCLKHGSLNPHGRFFQVTHQGKIIAYSWVWRRGEVLCFDNVEVTSEMFKVPNYEETIYQAYLKTANKVIKQTQQEEKPIQLVLVGRNEIDYQNSYFEKLDSLQAHNKTSIKPEEGEQLYLKDSENMQKVLVGDPERTPDTNEIKSRYQRTRKKATNFKAYEKQELEERINAIYFDYCLEQEERYHPLKNDYTSGYLGEDWFVGTKKDATQDFYYCGPDKRLFQEAKQYASQIKIKTPPKIMLNRSKGDRERYLLNPNNYRLNEKAIKAYLRETKSTRQEEDIAYLHSPGNLETLSDILKTNAITSAFFGNHEGGGGCNGPHFISIAKKKSNVYEIHKESGSIALGKDLTTFSTTELSQDHIIQQLADSTYPIRKTNFSGEEHVRNYISLNKALGIFASEEKLVELGQIIYLQELFEKDIPIILLEDETKLDKKEIKRHILVK